MATTGGLMHRVLVPSPPVHHGTSCLWSAEYSIPERCPSTFATVTWQGAVFAMVGLMLAAIDALQALLVVPAVQYANGLSGVICACRSSSIRKLRLLANTRLTGGKPLKSQPNQFH